MRFGKSIILLSCFFVLRLCLAEPADSNQSAEYAANFQLTAKTVLAPVYGPLAKQIAADYDLAGMKGVGIDLGSGPGNLIVELCKRTRFLTWINADINPHFFPLFLKAADEAGVGRRVEAVRADAQDLPFEDDYAEVIVSRGSFHMWQDKRSAFREIYRVLKPGGIALVGRGFSGNLPPEVAREVRKKQKGGPKYDPAETEAELREIMAALSIGDYRIRLPKPPDSEGINYGIWLEFRKPLPEGHR